jgi:hypothetical protein
MPFERRQLERKRDNEPLEVAGISRWHFKHRGGVWYGHLLFDYRPSRAQIGFTICGNRGHGISPHVRRCADADLGRLGDLSHFLLVVLSRSRQRWFYFVSLLMLILFVVIYNRVSKPINRLQTEAARTGESLNNGRELQAAWDRSVMIRAPLLVVSLLVQCLVLLVA